MNDLCDAAEDIAARERNREQEKMKRALNWFHCQAGGEAEADLLCAVVGAASRYLRSRDRAEREGQTHPDLYTYLCHYNVSKDVFTPEAKALALERYPAPEGGRKIPFGESYWPRH